MHAVDNIMHDEFIIGTIIMNGALRIANSLSQYEGRVEIYWNLEWKSICSDGWDELDAMVVCRQMKYLPTSVQIYGTTLQLLMPWHAYAYACHGACAYYVATMIFPALSYDDHYLKSKRSPILLTNVGCHGSENNLTSCCSVAIPSQFHCFNQTYAGVRCMQVD